MRHDLPTQEEFCTSISVDAALHASLTLQHGPDAGTRDHYRWRMNDEVSRRSVVGHWNRHRTNSFSGEAVP